MSGFALALKSKAPPLLSGAKLLNYLHYNGPACRINALSGNYREKEPFHICARAQYRVWCVRYSYISDQFELANEMMAGIVKRNILKYKELWAMVFPITSLLNRFSWYTVYA